MKRHPWQFVVLVAILLTAVAAAQDKPAPAPPVKEFKDLDSLMSTLPTAGSKTLNLDSALLLSAVPLSCIDELQPKPAQRPYFWQPSYRVIDGLDKNRAFYGCNDWATAVNSTWTSVILVKRYSDLPDREIIREKLTDHLGRQNLEGELAYFKTAGNFQRPYGYAWFLKLYAELATWRDPDGTRYAENAAPLARFFTDSLVSFLIDVERPNRTATQTNSAFVLGLLLDYVDASRDMTIGRAVNETAKRIFMNDTDCATDLEAVSPEMNSPCLEEASVMSRVLDQSSFVAWFDKFMPPVYSAKFSALRSVNLDAVGRGARGGRGRGAAPAVPGGLDAAGNPPTNPRSTWTGLAFTRAQAYRRLAAALPATDPRGGAFRKLAAIHAEIGEKGLAEPSAADTPWLNTFALSYLMTLGSAK
jgi:hypothetical protein